MKKASRSINDGVGGFFPYSGISVTGSEQKNRAFKPNARYSEKKRIRMKMNEALTCKY